MSGVPIIVQLLLTAPTVTALVKPADIVGDDLPTGFKLPAISVSSISRVEHNPLTAQAKRFVSERVQAKVLSDNAPKRGKVLKAVRGATAYAMPAFSDLTDIVIILMGTGPEGRDLESGIRTVPQDFQVSYNEPA